MGVTTLDQIETIRKLAQPLFDYMLAVLDEGCKIVVSDEGIFIEQTTIGIPIR